MTDNIISKSTIEQVYKEYQTRYNISLPIIQNINYINDDGFGQNLILVICIIKSIFYI